LPFTTITSLAVLTPKPAPDWGRVDAALRAYERDPA
jgi:hypothetical protein